MKKGKSQSNIKQLNNQCPNCQFKWNQIIESNKEIADYFKSNTRSPSENYNLIIELLYQAVQTRKGGLNSNFISSPSQLKQQIPFSPVVQSPKNLQNLIKTMIDQNIKSGKKAKTSSRNQVSYIKHNRFLSPNKKRQITPKITEIIPVSSQKHVIYGKPKVSLDDGYGCPMHQNCEEFDHQNQFLEYDPHFVRSSHTNQVSNPAFFSPQSPSHHQTTQNNHLQHHTVQNILDIPQQYEQYISPREDPHKKTTKLGNKNKNQKYGENNLNKTVHGQGYVSNRKEGHYQAQSKIKDMLDRDKRNKQLQKKLVKQQSLIQQLQERQLQMVRLQNYQRMIEQTGSSELYVSGEMEGQRLKFQGCRAHYPTPKHKCLNCKLAKLQVDDRNNKIAMKELQRQNQKRRSQLNIDLQSQGNVPQNHSYGEIEYDDQEIGDILSQQNFEGI